MVPETPTATPISIMQSLSGLRLKHMHVLGEHGADHEPLNQREAELANAQAHEVDARATGDTLLQVTHAVEDCTMRAGHTAILP